MYSHSDAKAMDFESLGVGNVSDRKTQRQNPLEQAKGARMLKKDHICKSLGVGTCFKEAQETTPGVFPRGWPSPLGAVLLVV
jgi:hypothetical protein